MLGIENADRQIAKLKEELKDTAKEVSEEKS